MNERNKLHSVNVKVYTKGKRNNKRVNNAQVEWYDQAVVFRKDPNYEVMHDQYQLFSC